MNKEYKAAILPHLKTLHTQELQRGILNGILLSAFAPDFHTLRAVVEEMSLLKRELKARGIKTVKEDTPSGLRLRFEKAEDTFAKQPVKMIIPTITELLSMPLPTDLPPHGYLTIQLPESMG